MFEEGSIFIQATPAAVEVEQENYHCDTSGCKGYKLIGDSLDKNVKARCVQRNSH